MSDDIHIQLQKGAQSALIAANREKFLAEYSEKRSLEVVTPHKDLALTLRDDDESRSVEIYHEIELPVIDDESRSVEIAESDDNRALMTV